MLLLMSMYNKCVCVSEEYVSKLSEKVRALAYESIRAEKRSDVMLQVVSKIKQASKGNIHIDSGLNLMSPANRASDGVHFERYQDVVSTHISQHEKQLETPLKQPTIEEVATQVKFSLQKYNTSMESTCQVYGDAAEKLQRFINRFDSMKNITPSIARDLGNECNDECETPSKVPNHQPTVITESRKRVIRAYRKIKKPIKCITSGSRKVMVSVKLSTPSPLKESEMTAQVALADSHDLERSYAVDQKDIFETPSKSYHSSVAASPSISSETEFEDQTVEECGTTEKDEGHELDQLDTYLGNFFGSPQLEKLSLDKRESSVETKVLIGLQNNPALYCWTNGTFL